MREGRSSSLAHLLGIGEFVEDRQTPPFFGVQFRNGRRSVSYDRLFQ